MATHIKAYDRNKNPLGLLPDFNGLMEQIQLNDHGVLTFTYAPEGTNVHFLDEDVLYMSLVEDGVEHEERYILDDDSGNVAASNSVGTTTKITSRGVLALFGHAHVYPKAHVPGGSVSGLALEHKFESQTIGAILIELIRRAKNRGALQAIEVKFTATHDSAGVAWPKQQTVTYAAGMKYLELMRAATNNGWMDMRMKGFELQCFVPDGAMAQVKPDVIIRTAKQVQNGPRQRSRRDIVTTMLGLGSEKNAVEAHDALAEAKYGRREGHASDGRMTEAGSLLAMTQHELESLKAAKVGFKLTLSAPRGTTTDEQWVIPGQHFDVGDKIFWDMRRLSPTEFEPLRVQSISQSWTNPDAPPSCEIELNDQFVERTLKLERQVNGIQQGSTTDAPPPTTTPEGPDVTVPVAPTGVQIEPTLYSTGADHRVSAAVSWVPVMDNQDGSAYVDHDAYLVSWSRDGVLFMGETLARQPFSWIGDLIPGTPLHVRVAAQDSSGNRSPYGTARILELPSDHSAPPQPTPPIVETLLGVSSIRWDGQGVDDPMPPDFYEVAVLTEGDEKSVEYPVSYAGPWVPRTLVLDPGGPMGAAVRLEAVTAPLGTTKGLLFATPTDAPGPAVRLELASLVDAHTLTLTIGDEPTVVDLAALSIGAGDTFHLDVRAVAGQITVAVNGAEQASAPLPAEAQFLLTAPADAAGATAQHMTYRELAYYPQGHPVRVGTLGERGSASSVTIANQEYFRTYKVWFIAYDRAGNASVPSDTVSFASAPLVDADLIGTTVKTELDKATAALDAIQDAYNDLSLDVDAVQVSANGKNSTHTTPTMPAGQNHRAGDIWMDTDDGNKIYTWSGSAWVHKPLGGSALSDAINSAITGATSTATAAQTAASNAQTAADAAAARAAAMYAQAENRMPDWSLEADGDGWVKPAGVSVVTSATAGHGTKVLRIATATAALHTYPGDALMVPTAAGRVWRVSFQARHAGTVPTAGAVRAVFRHRTTAGAVTTTVLTGVVASTLTAAWQTVTADFTVPADLVQIMAGVQVSAAGQTVEVDAFQLRDVTDIKGALDEAAAAKSAATAAQNAAGSAVTTADAAMTAASKRAQIFYSTAAPSGTGLGEGDTWFRRNAAGQIIGQWEWLSNAWVARQLDNAMFANIDAGKINAGFLEADRIKAGTIVAEKLLIGSTTNLIPNGAGELGSLAGWPSTLTWDTADKPAGEAGSFCSTVGQGMATASGEFFNVLPSTEYLTEIWIKADKPNSVLFVELRNQDGAQGATHATAPDSPSTGNASYVLGSVVVPTVWTKYTAVTTPTATTSRLRIGGLYFNHSTGTERTAQVRIAGFRMRPRNGASLIVDGSITARELAVGTITAESGIIGSLDAGTITVGTLNAARLGANSITADKVLIGSGANLLLDPYFAAKPAWSNSAFVQPDGGRLSGGCLLIPQSATQAGVYMTTVASAVQYMVPVTEGTEYRVGGWVRFEGTATPLAAHGTIYARFLRASAGTLEGTTVVATNSAGLAVNTWHWVEGSIVVPAGMTHMVLGCYKQAGYSTGPVRWDGILLAQKMSGELIVDGAITARAIATGAITAEKIFANAVTADKIAANAVTADKIIANAVTTDKINAGAITATKIATDAITADKIQANAINGMTITGALVRSAATGSRVEMSTTGIVAYDPSNVLVAKLAGTGAAGAGGTFMTYYASGQPSVVIGNFFGAPVSGLEVRSASGGAFLSANNNPGGTTFGVSADTVDISAKNANGIILRSQIRYDGRPTSTFAANLGIATTPEDVIYKLTSSARSKVAIEDLDPALAYRILDVPTRDWFDRTQVEDYVAAIADQETGEPDEAIQARAGLGIPFRRIPGVVAEEVAEAGLEQFVTYEPDPDNPGQERTSGVMYDRMWTLMIPILRDHEEKIAALAARIEELEAAAA